MATEKLVSSYTELSLIYFFHADIYIQHFYSIIRHLSQVMCYYSLQPLVKKGRIVYTCIKIIHQTLAVLSADGV